MPLTRHLHLYLNIQDPAHLGTWRNASPERELSAWGVTRMAVLRQESGGSEGAVQNAMQRAQQRILMADDEFIAATAPRPADGRRPAARVRRAPVYDSDVRVSVSFKQFWPQIAGLCSAAEVCCRILLTQLIMLASNGAFNILCTSTESHQGRGGANSKPGQVGPQVPEANSDGDYTDGSEFMAGADEPDSDVDFDFDVLAEEEVDDDAAARVPTLAASRRARAREAAEAAAPAAAEAQPAEGQHRYSTRRAFVLL